MQKKKGIALVLSFALVACLGVAGVLAWLTDTTDEIENTFTVGNINIDLTEEGADDDGKQQFKMVPGNKIDKKPVVTVEANSEDCYLFVEVLESDNLDDFITYEIDDSWTALAGVDNVYYRTVAASSANQDFGVIGIEENDQFVANKVLVNGEVTKAMMDELTEETYPTLTFKAYAIQAANMADANAAWTALRGQINA